MGLVEAKLITPPDPPKSILDPPGLKATLTYGPPQPQLVVDFSGDYRTWEEAAKVCTGWSDPAILEKVRAGALKVKRGEAAFERDSVPFSEPGYRWPLTTCLLMTAHRGGGQLHVVDFGGSLGSTFVQHRAILRDVSNLMWSVVEQPHFVACGNAEFSTDSLRFFETIEDAAARAHIDLMLFSSTLQYLAAPYDLMHSVMRRGVSILIDRLPLTNSPRDLIQVQHVCEPIYNANYPHRTFARGQFWSFVKTNEYTVEFSFPAAFDGPNYFGFFLSRRPQ